MAILRQAMAVCGFAVLVLAPTAGLAAGTPDGLPPSQETICDEEPGAAYGLCVAYCEANDCDEFPTRKGNRKACQVLRKNYTKLTGFVEFPCDPIVPPDNSK